MAGPASVVAAARRLQVVDAQGGRALALPSVRATLSWESLVVLELRLASLEIDAPDLTIRRDAEGQLFVAGFPIRRKASPDSKVGEWLLAQHEIRIRQARLVWRDEWRAPSAGRERPRPDGRRLRDRAVRLDAPRRVAGDAAGRISPHRSTCAP